MGNKDKTKNRNKNRNKNNKARTILLLILRLIFISLLIFSSIKVVKYIKDSKKNEEIIDEISKSITINDTIEDTIENEEKYNIDFKTLKEKNSDIIGFLKVNGTDVESIIVKGKDNSYYLSHNIEKEYNIAGWIFADYRNKLDGTDKNVIIYGHNMRNNTMFGTLKNILNSDWQENEDNRKIIFITENESAIYDVFSVYQIKAEDYYTKTNFESGEFKKYIDSMKTRSIYNFNENISEDDSILTLSTCANNNKYRVILHAKKIKE